MEADKRGLIQGEGSLSVVKRTANRVGTAIAISMLADARYAIMETGFGNPPRVVIDGVSAPMKHVARSHATHSILITRLLSSDIVPKP